MLQELMESAVDYDQLWDELEEYATIVTNIIDQSLLNEGDGSTALDAVIKQMEAAKRGLGIVNKLKPGPDRAKHASRVMGNMNRIRAHIKRIEKALAKAAHSEAA